MARKKIATSELNEVQEGMRRSIIEGMNALYEQHATGIDKLLKDAEEPKCKVNFGVTIDCSQSAPKVDISIRYSDTVTDHRTYSLEDPQQPQLFEEPPKAKRSGKDAAAGEGTEEAE